MVGGGGVFGEGGGGGGGAGDAGVCEPGGEGEVVDPGRPASE